MSLKDIIYTIGILKILQKIIPLIVNITESKKMYRYDNEESCCNLISSTLISSCLYWGDYNFIS